MNRRFILSALIAITLCGAAAGALARGPAAGSATAEDMLGLLPANAMGVFFLDAERAMATPFAQKFMEENSADLEEFMEKTGIDPRKDIHCLAGIIGGDEESMEEPDWAVVINADVDATALLEMAKEESGEEFIVSKYEGVTVVEMPGEGDEGPTHAAILDDSNLAFGVEEYVLTVIDVYQGRAKNVLTNADITALMGDVNKGGIMWAAITVPQEATADLQENPMLGGLKDLYALVANLDYRDANLVAEIIARSESPETTKQLGDFLRGLKAMGAMFSAEEPETAELINAIEITDGPDHVRLKAMIPEAILMKDKEEAPEEMEAEEGGW